MTIGLGHYLTVAAILFTLGIFGIFLNRKNVIVILMSIELILLAVNINLVAFSTLPRRPRRPGLRAARAHRRGRRSRDRARHSRRLLPQSRLDRGRRHQPDEGLRTAMYQAIVFLPLLGAIIAGLIALAGAVRVPGRRRSRALTTRAARMRAVRTRRPASSTTRITNDAHAQPAAAGSRPPSSSPRRCCSSRWCCRGSRSSRSASAITTCASLLFTWIALGRPRRSTGRCASTR